MQTIEPPPRAAIIGTAYLLTKNALVRLRSSCERQISSSILTRLPGSDRPTLLTRILSPPCSATNVSNTCLTWPEFVTSQAATCMRLPSPLTSACVSCAAASEISRPSTVAPCRANRTDIALPLPQPGPEQPQPVISATFPLRFSMGGSY